MAFKIKDNLDLYGNQLLNFALQSDSGFPQSPQVGHIFNYTGTGVMANHAVMCVDETTKAFKALAFVDEIATNTAFTELAERVLTIEKALGEDTANVIDTWEEIQNFLKDINANDANLMTMLNSKLDKSGGTITYEGDSGVRLFSTNLSSNYLWFEGIVNGSKVNLGALGMRGYNNPAYVSPTGFVYGILHEGNYSSYALPKSGGILTSSVLEVLGINTTNNTKNAGIGWYNNGTRIGVLRLVGDMRAQIYDATFNESVDIITTGNIGKYAPIYNANGNVLIGTTEDKGAKLQVEGKVFVNRYGAENLSGGADIVLNKAGNYYVGIGSASSDKTSFAIGRLSTITDAWVNEDIVISDNGYVKVDCPLIISGAVTMSSTLSVDGNTHIKGNLIVDGEVSAGGAGQEGESGDGGAEVIDKELAKGQSSYTIPNTIGRSAVAVSLYEWNANNGSWDMCLADIAVKDATITVTFGSATSVNHKLVAVG